MIKEGLTIQGPQSISLALTPIEWWESAKQFLKSLSASEAGLTTFAVVALIISVILVFWVMARHRHSEHCLKQKIAILTATNEKLQQEIDELNREQVDVLENIIDAKPSRKKIPGFNPQEMKALSELAKRLR